MGGWTSPVPCRNIFFKYVTSTREDERSDVSAKISRRQPTRRASWHGKVAVQGVWRLWDLVSDY